MKSDTVAVHGGYETEPTTKAVAVPIYQTVAYEFDSAEHGAALFNLEAEGFRYSRISNPTVAVLERRVAELEGGLEAMCVSSGQAALNYAVLNLAEMGSNIVSVPQLYGTTHTLFGHVLPSQGIATRFAESDQADAIEKLIDEKTRGDLLRERRQSGGQYLRHRGAGRGRRPPRRSARRRQYRSDPDPLAADRLRRRYRRALADQVHGRARHHARRRDRRQRPLPVEGTRAPLSDVQRAGRLLSRLGLYRAFRPRRLYRALPQRLSAHDRRGAGAVFRLSSAARDRDRGVARRAPRRERAPRRRIPAPGPPGRVGQLCRLSGQPLSRAGAEIFRRPRLLAPHLRHRRRIRSAE